MTNLDSIFKSRDITLPTKVRLVKAMVFPVVMYGCESWTVKKAELQRIDAFERWCWRRLLRVPWTARRSNQSILKPWDQPWDFFGRNDAKAEIPEDMGIPPGPGWISIARIIPPISMKEDNRLFFLTVQFSSVAQSCPTLCDPMNRSTPGLPVHHQLPEFTQTHVHRVSDAIQPSHLLSFPSPPAPNPSQHQSLFQ